MQTLFWNIRGFGHDGHRRQLIEYIRDEHIDIIAIQETLRTEFALQELESLSSHLFAWHWLPSSGTSGHSGGILSGVKDATFCWRYALEAIIKGLLLYFLVHDNCLLFML